MRRLTMRPALFHISALVATLELAGCASEIATVRNIAAENTACDASEISVTKIGESNPGVNHYQTTGCGITHNYRCEAMGKAASTAAGLASRTYLDFAVLQPCVRENR